MEKKIERYIPLFEMAFPKYEIESKIIDSQFRIIEHIVKLLLYPEHKEYHKGWANSIHKQITNIADMRWIKNNFYLKQKNYYKYFFDAPFENGDNYGHLDKMLKYVISETKKIYKKKNLENYNKDIWISLIKGFYGEVSVFLAEGEEDWNIYNKLIKKYFVK